MLARMGFLAEVSGPPISEAPSPNWIFDRIDITAELSAKGVQPRDRVGILMENVPDARAAFCVAMDFSMIERAFDPILLSVPRINRTGGLSSRSV